MKSVTLSEYQEQCIVADYMRKRWPDVLWTATAGGMRTSIGTATKMKRAGLSKGVPDILIFFRQEETIEAGVNYICPGLALEMKVRKGGVVSKDQKDWMKRLEAQGWQCHICHGADEAIAAIEEYLK